MLRKIWFVQAKMAQRSCLGSVGKVDINNNTHID